MAFVLSKIDPCIIIVITSDTDNDYWAINVYGFSNYPDIRDLETTLLYSIQNRFFSGWFIAQMEYHKYAFSILECS